MRIAGICTVVAGVGLVAGCTRTASHGDTGPDSGHWTLHDEEGCPSQEPGNPGTLDSAFGSGGILVIGSDDMPAPDNDGMFGPFFVQPSADLLITGMSDLRISGEFDSSHLDTYVWSTSGTLTQTLSIPFDRGLAEDLVAVLPGGDYLTVGSDSTHPYLSRRHPDGSVDKTFGIAGRAEADDAAFGAMRIDDAGDVVVAAMDHPESSSPVAAVYRFTPDGFPDSSFGSGGKVELTSVPFLDFSHPEVTLYDLVVQPNGKIVVVGGWDDDGYVAFRLHHDGVIDDSYGSHGEVIGQFPSRANGWLSQATLDPDGSVMALAVDGNGNDLVRFTVSGALDPTFGEGGFLDATENPTADPSQDTQFDSMGVQNDGKIVLAGMRPIAANYTMVATDYLLRRFNVDGSNDVFFGDEGVTQLDVGPWDNGGLAGMTACRIYIAGQSTTTTDPWGNSSMTAAAFWE